VSGDLSGRVIQWDVASGKIEREFEARDFHLLHRLQDIAGLRKLIFDPEGTMLVAAGSIPTGGANVRGHGRVRMWDFESGRVRHDLAIGEDQKDVFAHDVALHPDGFFIAVTTGQPGQGSLILQRPEDTEPFFSTNKGTVNCHGASLSPDGKQLAVSATNARSNGNGRRLDEEGGYPANHSPIHLFELEEVAAATA
jgi:WD40 repeat protein